MKEIARIAPNGERIDIFWKNFAFRNLTVEVGTFLAASLSNGQAFVLRDGTLYMANSIAEKFRGMLPHAGGTS